MAEAAAVPAQTTVTTGAANDAWHASYDTDTKGWITGKGFDKLDAAAVLPELVKGYRGAERTLGVPADQIIRMPGKDAKPEDYRAIYTRLGLPANADGYEIQAPQGDDGAFLKTASGWFHEIGLPKGMGQALAGKWNEYRGKVLAEADAAWNTRFEKEVAELRGEWAADYDKYIDLSNRVLRAGGISVEHQRALETAMGPKAFRQVFAKFAGLIGEHRFEGGQSTTGSFAMSPEQAKARIGELEKDAAWVKKYTAGDADAKAEFTRLNKIAYPEPIAP